ncbi:MAG: amino acid adenylation domain-containing protein, partial [Desulfobacterales bacterium]|nr:amino acid adenylation domain-containing protein [Desulfobacterales bacterium]
MLDRSEAMAVGVLGVLKAGGAYAPIDPDLPASRVQYLISDSGCRVLLTQSECMDRVPDSLDVPVVELEKIPAGADHNPAARIRPDQLAYVIYTSGSTGAPKGVMIEHGSLVNAAVAWRRAYGLGRDLHARLLQMASLSFDVFTGDLIRALTTGGRLIICPAGIRIDPPSLYKLLAEHRVNIFESTPGVILPLMEYIHEKSLEIDFLKLLILGSDAVRAEPFKKLLERFGDRMRIINSYGVTEASIDSSFFETGEKAFPPGGVTPVGRPLQNTTYYILDANGLPAPLGARGELYIGGAGLARGYLNREALTAERFIPHPFRTGERLYRTGDLARWLPDGNLLLSGRQDDQVKIRGFRIEPGEIECRLLEMEGVTGAVVAAADTGAGEKDLAAYLESRAGLKIKEIRAHLKKTLPEYMIPSIFVLLDRFPLNPNGKIDRKALPDPTRAAIKPGEALAPPRDEAEKTLVRIWQTVLGVKRVGIHDNFFELGGHSLKAMQIVSRIRQSMEVKIELKNFFNAPTVAGLAPLVRAADAEAFAAIRPAPTREHYNLSHAQRRLWLLHYMKGASAYNMPAAYILEDVALDHGALEKAFNTLVERHEALRTAFVVVDGEPRQKILPRLRFTLRRIDPRGKEAAEKRAEKLAEKRAEKLAEKLAGEMADQEASAPFDLASPPLLRAVSIRMAEKKYMILLTLHHIIGDGWSETILYREVLALYDAFRRGRPNPLPPPRIQYKDFAEWQNARGFEKEEAYWLNRLAGGPGRLKLPYDFPPGEERDFRGAAETRIIDPGAVRGVRRLAVQSNTTVSNVILAVFHLFLHRLTGQADFRVGMAIANRDHPDLENLIGFFVNILPIRIRVSDDMEFHELLEEVNRVTADAFRHQDYPFDLLVRKLHPARQANRQPVLNVVYAFQSFTDIHVDMGLENRDGEEEDESAYALENFEIPLKTSKFDLTLFVSHQEETLHLHLEYDTGLFRADTIHKHLSTLERFIRLVAGTTGKKGK